MGLAQIKMKKVQLQQQPSRTFKIFTNTTATILGKFVIFRKFVILLCLMTTLFIINSFTAKAQIGIQVSGAGSSDVNGSYTPVAPNNGHPAWLFVGPTSYDYYIYFSTALNQWVLQYQKRYDRILTGVSYYCNANPGNNPDKPVDNGWFLVLGTNPPAPTSQQTTRQIYYDDNDGDGYAPNTAQAKNDYFITPAPVYAKLVLSTLAKGTADCDDYNDLVYVTNPFYLDADGDEYGSNTVIYRCQITPPTGYVTNNTDCNDNDVTKHTTFPFYADTDGDGFGAGNLVSVCAVNATTPPSGYSVNNTDCNDNDATIHPYPFYIDADGDGFGAGNLVSVCAINAITPPSGYSTNNTDCNPTDATKHALFPFYVDADRDGYGAGNAVNLCAVNATSPPTGYSINNTDCNDYDATKRATYLFYIDADGDGFGAGSLVSVCAVNAATPPSGYSVNNTDCNDSNPNINRPIPVQAYTTASTVCAGSPTTLIAGGGFTPTYTWSGGANNVMNGVPFVPTATTTYTITSVFSGCVATASITITVNPLPIVTASAINPTFCNSATTVLNFDGVDDYIAQPFAINGNSGTWQAWVQKANWADTNDQRLFGNGIDAANNNSFYISLHPGVGFHFRYGGAGQAGNNYVSSLATKSFAPNSWHHLAAAWSWNGSQTILVIFLDGVAAGNNIAALNLSLTAPSYIGGDAVNPKFGAGSMEEISLWNIPRNAAAIATSYASSTAYPQAGLYSLLNLNSAIVNGNNADTLIDNANTTVSTLNNFALSGASSNYISQNVPINHFVTLTGNGASTYSWTNGISNGVSFVPTVSNTYVVTGTDVNGCVATASQIVTVNQAPNISITAGTTNICIPSSTVLNFDGVDDYISQPIAINGNNGTWQAWVQKVNWADANDQRLFGNGIDAANNNSFYISLHPGVGFHFRYGGAGQAGNNYVSSLATKSFAPNSWHHLAAAWSWNGSQTILVIFLDGVAVGNNISTLNLYLNAPSYIGGDATNPKFGRGSMKEISLWNIPRPPANIATTYAASTGYPQSGMYSLLSFNSAKPNDTNTNTIIDNANAAVATLNNFALSGANSNYISAVVPIIQTPITLTATGASTYIWSGGITNGSPFGLNASNTYTVTGTDANGCIATATQAITTIPTYTITASAGSNGSISNVGATTLCGGNNQTYTIIPNGGYRILDILIDGTSNAGAITGGTFTFASVNTAHTISATFAYNCVTNAAPVTSPVNYNVGVTAVPLMATASVNSTLLWYGTSSAGGSSSTTAPTPLTNSAGTTTYYVSQRDQNSCESARASLVVTVSIPNISPPTGAASQTFCSGKTLADLVVSGTAIKWYNASSGGSLLPTSTVLVNGTVYYATQTVSGFESVTRLAVTVTVNIIPTLTLGTVTNPTPPNNADGSIGFTTNLPNGTYSLSYLNMGSPKNVTVTSGAFALTDLTSGIYSKFSVTYNGCTGINYLPVKLGNGSTLVVSIATGNWESSNTWNVGRMPKSGDVVTIDAGHTVTMNGNGTVKDIDVKGQLKYAIAGILLNVGL